MEEEKSRLDYLRRLLDEDPAEPFLHYAVCLELKKSGRGATHAFRKLIQDFPQYLPAYYQAALLLAEEGETSDAAALANEGIRLAESQSDLHALSELKGLRQNILAGEFD